MTYFSKFQEVITVCLSIGEVCKADLLMTIVIFKSVVIGLNTSGYASGFCEGCRTPVYGSRI